MAQLTEKYRPTSFSELVGQEDAVRWCRRDLSGECQRSLIIHGVTGTGKTTLARIRASALLCKAPEPTVRPCLQCDSCREFRTPGSHWCYQEIDCPVARGVEDIEPVLNGLRSHPMGGRYRICMFDEVDRLSHKARAAMLKLLEALPATSVVMLVTMDITKLPPEIQNRCQRLELKPVSLDVGRRHLVQVCEKEGITYELAALDLIWQASEGQVRELIQNLDQAIDETRAVRETEVRRLFNLDYIESVCNFITAGLTGNLDRQIAVVQAWPDVPYKKAQAVHDALVFLLMNDVLRRRYSSPTFASMPLELRA